MKSLLRTSTAVGILLLGVISPARADFQKGLEAYQAGNYAAALKEWKPLAEQGLAKAQHNIGVMYYKGRGVPQDYAQAFRWARLAAEQGFALAQFNLGVMYAEGQGVPQDYVQAYMWYTVADANGDKKGLSNRDGIARKMTPAQIARAEQLVRAWKPKK